MSRGRRSSLTSVVVLLVVCALGWGGARARADGPTCGVWNEQTAPNGSTGNVHLYGVSALATDDVWMSGQREDSSGVFRTLAEQVVAQVATGR